MALDKIGFGHLHSEVKHQVLEAEDVSHEKHKVAPFSLSISETSSFRKSLADNAPYIKYDTNEEVVHGYLAYNPSSILDNYANGEVPIFHDMYQTPSIGTWRVSLGKNTIFSEEPLYGSSGKYGINQTPTTKVLQANVLYDAPSVNTKFGVKEKVFYDVKEEVSGGLHVENYTFDQTDKHQAFFRCRTQMAYGETETTLMDVETNVCNGLQYEMTNKRHFEQAVATIQGNKDWWFQYNTCGKIFPNQKRIVENGLRNSGEKPPAHNVRHQELACSAYTGQNSSKDETEMEVVSCSHEGHSDSVGAIIQEKNTKRPAEFLPDASSNTCFPSAVRNPSVVNRTKGTTGCVNKDDRMSSEGKQRVKEKLCEIGKDFCCDICGKRLSCRLTLNKHYLIHTGKKPFLCETCGRGFSTRQLLREHNSSHTGEKPYICDICGKRFKSTSGFSYHIVHKADGRILACRGTYATRKNNKGRVGSKDKTDKGDKSNFLTETLPAYGRLTNDGKLMCEICGKSFSDRFDFMEHERDKCIPVKNTPFVCEFCGRRFSLRPHLVDHRRIHTGEKPFVCEKCGKRFRQDAGLRCHRRHHHEDKVGRESFICDVCGRAFSTPNLLRSHSGTHATEKNFLCDICGKTFNQDQKLVNHLNTHNTTKLFECSECGNKFKTKDSLKKHGAIHSGEKRYVCELCGKRFIYNSELKCHRRTHTGEKPFACKTCGKRFTQSGRLKEHERTHTDERPHVCDTCGKAFRGRSDLTVHIRLHTGEKPYVCRLCGEAFIVSYGLRMHHSRKHADNNAGN